MLFLKIIILVTLSLIFIQDIRSRSVYWICFPVLAITFILLHFLQQLSFAETLQYVLVNISFLALQFLILSIYFSIKNKGWFNVITAGLLGWGDLLFLLSIAFYLSALNFLFFYIFSLVAVLIIWVVWLTISKTKNKQIPLAGLQALIFIVFLAGDWWIRHYNLTNDAWLLNLIIK